jgi:hypothetical protein
MARGPIAGPGTAIAAGEFRRALHATADPMMELLASLEQSGFATWMRESPSIWAYPTILTLHTLGLGVLVGGSAVLDLRVLGFAPAIPLPPLERLFPALWVGFWVNAISGVALFAGDATTKGTTRLFVAKLVIVAVGVLVLVALRRTVYGRRAEPAAVSTTSRALAAMSLVLWFLAIVAGRYMAYV